MHTLGITELAIVLTIAAILFRPRRKPPVHPAPSGDAALLRRIRLSRKD